MAAVVAQSHFLFGLRTGVKNNVCFLDEQTLVFPCGNNCVCYNTAEKSQRVISGSEQSLGMCALALSANRRYLAVSEGGEKASITVFDLQHEQGRKRKVLTAGEIPAEQFVCMAFSPDSKYLVGQTGAPEWTLILWLWEKHKVLATVKSTHSDNPVTHVSFNPHNGTQLCASGSGLFKLFRYSEGTLKQSSSPKVELIDILCHAWTTEGQVIGGTDTGRLLLFESGALRREISAPTESDRSDVGTNREVPPTYEGAAASRITAVVSFSKGFACSVGPDLVCVYERAEDKSSRKSREIRVDAHIDG
ncbi:unnamed protein product [Lampetra planeri]